MKIELSIKTTYLPEWGAFEGIRELIQNGKDAETEFNAPLGVRHRADTKKLLIENKNTSLPHEALLFGHTTKTGKEDLIGKFGEGLKLGALALVRAGYDIKIRSGAEVWVPKIEKSEKFQADVLVFYISKGRQPKNRVQIEVSNVSEEEWSQMKGCFLFLNKKINKEYRIDTRYGALLLGEENVGRVFVKGIFVEHDPKLVVGYDLTKDVSVDRDRKMIARYDLSWRMREIWVLSIGQRQELMAKFMGLLEDSAGDVSDLDSYGARQLPREVREQAAASFKEKHGEDAVPVATMLDSKDIEHYGKKGVVVNNKPLQAVLETIFGTADEIKRELANEVAHAYGWSELTYEEKSNLESAIELVNAVEPVTLAEIDIVDFRSEKIEGMYKEDRFLIAKNKLSRNSALEVLIHEVAHRGASFDGSHSHVCRIEKIWSGIVANLRDAS